MGNSCQPGGQLSVGAARVAVVFVVVVGPPRVAAAALLLA